MRNNDFISLLFSFPFSNVALSGLPSVVSSFSCSRQLHVDLCPTVHRRRLRRLRPSTHPKETVSDRRLPADRSLHPPCPTTNHLPAPPLRRLHCLPFPLSLLRPPSSKSLHQRRLKPRWILRRSRKSSSSHHLRSLPNPQMEVGRWKWVLLRPLLSWFLQQTSSSRSRRMMQFQRRLRLQQLQLLRLSRDLPPMLRRSPTCLRSERMTDFLATTPT